jgi:hypothetical protein
MAHRSKAMKTNPFPELLARHPGDLLGEEAENA